MNSILSNISDYSQNGLIDHLSLPDVNLPFLGRPMQQWEESPLIQKVVIKSNSKSKLLKDKNLEKIILYNKNESSVVFPGFKIILFLNTLFKKISQVEVEIYLKENDTNLKLDISRQFTNYEKKSCAFFFNSSKEYNVKICKPDTDLESISERLKKKRISFRYFSI